MTQRPKAFYIVYDEFNNYSSLYGQYKDAFNHAQNLAKRLNNHKYIICKTIVEVTSNTITPFDLTDELEIVCENDKHEYPWRDRCIKCGALSPIWPARIGISNVQQN